MIELFLLLALHDDEFGHDEMLFEHEFDLLGLDKLIESSAPPSP
jgi:hypothetical protein